MTPSKVKGVRIEGLDDATEIKPRAPWNDSGSHASETAAEPEDDAAPPFAGDAPSIDPIPGPTREHVAARVRAIVTADDTPPTKAASGDDPELESGTKLGEYKIDAKIGEGGMGVVYSAIHPLIGKRAAVKVLKAELCRSAFNVERFIDEARVVNQIGHPNIVDVFAFGATPDGRSYFVMEWLKGESLRDRIARSRLDLEEICEVIRPLARALDAAHEQGVIHRDLKPDNIFLVDVRGEAPLVKLLDFGIAKLSRQEHRMERTATGAMVGTPQYIAPEQAKGYAIDHRVDIYSLGGIVFELLTGRPPFVADNAMEMVAKHLMEPPPRPSDFTQVPPELDELVLRMLSKDPAGRPTLAEIATAIERTSALDRTNVKTPAAPPLGDETSRDPHARPSPLPRAPLRAVTPVSSTDAMGRESHPALAHALANAMAATGPTDRVSFSDLEPPVAETAPVAKKSGGRGLIFVMVGATLAAAVIAFAIVWSAGDAAPKFESVPSQPPTANVPPPVEEPPAIEIEPEPAIVAAPEPVVEPPAPQPEPPKQTVKKPPSAPPAVPKKKRDGRHELDVQGARGAPQIFIDGKSAGSGTTVAPGVHTIEIRSTGAKTKTLRVTVGEGETVRRQITLEPLPNKSEPPKPSDKDLLAPGSIK